MADLKQNMLRHLRSARQWLSRAEESFGQERDIRGELDLLLAQAELQHVRETNRARQPRYKYLLLRHGLAVTLAISLVATGAGAYWLFKGQNPAAPVPLAGQEAQPIAPVVKKPAITETPTHTAADKPPVGEKSQPAAPNPVVPVVQAVYQPAEPKQEINQYRQETKDHLLSPDEMQKLIRAAGKSLRGQ